MEDVTKAAEKKVFPQDCSVNNFNKETKKQDEILTRELKNIARQLNKNIKKQTREDIRNLIPVLTDQIKRNNKNM